MFVIGTAGHIDHGKSAIIKRLTGTDPDRLPEEKERGMTIDIGFAHFDTSDGQRIGIIDVPGHERFVRNMIAGTGGIDAVMLVIAADDGWMPQSQEHLQITRLLDIRHGLVALTKIDMVEKSWLDLVQEDILERLQGSFLEGAPIVRLSSVTGEGYDILKQEIENLSRKVQRREDIGKPRLFVDRSFVLAGMGGVVAGTLRGGVLSIGQEVAVFPAKHKGKVRTIQSHGEQIKSAEPGQRTSISLTGIDKEFLNRGDVISSVSLIQDYPTEPVFALTITLLPEAPIVLESRRRLLMILGTTEIEGELRTPGDGIISPGQAGIIFFKPYSPVLGFIGDRFIVRLPTPQVTVGGGQIIDILEKFPRKKDAATFEYLKERDNLDETGLVNSELYKSSFINPRTAFAWCNYSQNQIDTVIARLAQENRIKQYKDQYYLIETIQPILSRVIMFVKNEMNKNPHLDGLSIDIIASGINLAMGETEKIIELMCMENLLIKKKNRFDLPDRVIEVKGNIKTLADKLESELANGGYAPPSIEELLGNDKQKKEALEFLVNSGKAVKAGQSFVFHSSAWAGIIAHIKNIFEIEKELNVALLREKLETTRKYIIPILEETDRRRITVRQGDVRVKGDYFEKG